MFSQIGIGIPNPDASAVLELASKQKGFLPPRLTTTERDAISQPAQGLTIYNTTKKCLEWYLASGWYNACGDNGVATVTNYTCSTLVTGTMEAGTPVSGVSQTITATVTVPGSYNISTTQNGVTFSARGNFTSAGNHDIVLHAAGTPTTAGDHDFVLNTSPNSCSFRRTTTPKIQTVVGGSGRIWMAYNLGATAPAAASNDASQYGDYYQWGRETDGHEKLNSGTTTTLSRNDSPGHANFIIGTGIPSDWRSPANNNLWQGVTGINNPCPAGFRLPTAQEWIAEFNSSAITNAATAFASALKLPIAGSKNTNGQYSNTALRGLYWSSASTGQAVTFTQTRIDYQNLVQRASGNSVRCIKD
ncbi:hypothetical protein B0A66_19890 [Flavobacterium hercynium]|uniref:Uncharacterized protein n=2 Tax=Flavobacterium hercynium TaxID=387094 RepID=A0A226GV35_9FLAO|nr:hypothetical protein B0A66_19890 [Flavobacterium hercynium]